MQGVDQEQLIIIWFSFFFSSRRRHTRWNCDWSSDVCSSDLAARPDRDGARRDRAAESPALSGRTRPDAEDPMFFKQLFDPASSTLTYLIADDSSHEAVLIDPVTEQVEREVHLLREHGLALRY